MNSNIVLVSTEASIMEDPFTAEFQGTHIHINYPPGFVITPEAVENVWGMFAKFCDKYNCRKVLVEISNMKSQLDTMDTFESARQLSQVEPPMSVAFCLYDYQLDDLTTFFKTVTENRGVKVNFFSNTVEAKEWLSLDAIG